MSRDIPVDDKYYTRLAEQYRKTGQDDEVDCFCEKICPEGRADLYSFLLCIATFSKSHNSWA